MQPLTKELGPIVEAVSGVVAALVMFALGSVSIFMRTSSASSCVSLLLLVWAGWILHGCATTVLRRA